PPPTALAPPSLHDALPILVVTAVTLVALLALTGEGARDLLLAALVSLVLLLRSRLFDRVAHVLPIRLGGVLGLAVVGAAAASSRSEEHTSELQSRENLVRR